MTGFRVRLHQPTHRRALRRRERPTRRHPRRRHQPRPGPHGRRQPWCHPRQADLDRGRLHTPGNLQGGAGQDHRRPSRAAYRIHLGRRHHVILRPAILPLGQARRRCRKRSTPATATIPAWASTRMSPTSTDRTACASCRPPATRRPTYWTGCCTMGTALRIGTHYTDTGGASDHVFIPMRHAGFSGSVRGYATWPTASSPPSSQPRLTRTWDSLIGRRVKADVIREHWGEILRLVASLQAGTVLPSAMLRRLAAYQRPEPARPGAAGAGAR